MIEFLPLGTVGVVILLTLISDMFDEYWCQNRVFIQSLVTTASTLSNAPSTHP